MSGGSFGQIATSTDGLGWTTVLQCACFDDYLSLVYSGSRFVAVGEGGRVATSPDGQVWSLGASGTSVDLLATAASGSRFVAVGENGTVIHSSDGLAWTPATLDVGTTDTLASVTWSGTQFVAVGGLGLEDDVRCTTSRL